jgi:dihydrofolate reductase
MFPFPDSCIVSISRLSNVEKLLGGKETKVGRIVVTEFVSVDGVIEDPGGAGDFVHRGWGIEISRGDEGDNFKIEETRNTEALLLGRKTYETFADSWPSRTGEFADMFNALPKYVVSSTLDHPTWTKSTVLTGDVLTAVSDLKRNVQGDIVIHGSAQLVQSLLENDLIDALHLMVFPVVLGQGKRLFGATSDKKSLRLADSTVVGDGVNILIYERA